MKNIQKSQEYYTKKKIVMVTKISSKPGPISLTRVDYLTSTTQYKLHAKSISL